MNADVSSKYIKAIVIAELLISAGIIIFWALFFTVGLIKIQNPELKEIYNAYEYSFVFPDLLLSIILIIAALHLMRKNPNGFLYSIIAGAMLIFVGLLDISFNLLNGIYQLGIGEAVLNGLINLACVVFGYILISFGKRFLI